MSNPERTVGENYARPLIPHTDYANLKPHLEYRRNSFPDVPTHVNLGRAFSGSGFTGRQFGRISGVDHTGISKILSGQRMDIALHTAVDLFAGLRLREREALRIVNEAATKSYSGIVIGFSETAPALEGTFPQQLAGYRKARDLSQRGLAKKIGHDHSAISWVEAGKREPRFGLFADLVFFFGLNIRQYANLRNAARLMILSNKAQEKAA